MNKETLLAGMMFGGGGGNGLPAIEGGDAGKVLKVNSGETGTEWGDVPNELPAIASGDAGKVLKVNSGATGVEWGAGGGSSAVEETITMTTAQMSSFISASSSFYALTGYTFTAKTLNDNYDKGIVLKISGSTLSNAKGAGGGGDEPGTTEYSVSFAVRLNSKTLTRDTNMSIDTIDYTSEWFVTACNTYKWYVKISVDATNNYINWVRLYKV